MGRKIYYDEIKEHIEREGYKILTDKIINANEMFLIKCPKGHEYETNYYRFKNISKCPYCARNKKFTYKEVKDYVESYGYELISTEYIRALDKLIFKCPNGHVFERTFAKFKNNKKCPICQGQHIWNYEEVKNYIASFGYELLSKEYKTMSDKIKIKCDKGHEYECSFNGFKNSKRRCPVCANNQTLTYEYVKEYIQSFGHRLISKEYVNTREPLEVECEKGHKYRVRYYNFKSGYRCPTCANKINGENSKGEIIIKNYLDKHNIKYVHDEGCFEDLLSCKGVKLRPDFILPEYKIWIEFDGQQHYNIIKHFGGLDKFITLKIHDTFKDVYAKEHEYKMIRIPYWNINNIEKILNKELKIS